MFEPLVVDCSKHNWQEHMTNIISTKIEMNELYYTTQSEIDNSHNKQVPKT